MKGEKLGSIQVAYMDITYWSVQSFSRRIWGKEGFEKLKCRTSFNQLDTGSFQSTYPIGQNL